MKKISSLIVSVIAVSNSIAAPEPIVASDWFPQVNGAVLEYQNIYPLSSSSAKVTVQTGISFNGQVTSRYSMDVSCNLTSGKSDWAVSNKSNGACRSRDRHFVTDANGLREIGEVIDNVDYGFASNQTYSRTATYSSLAPSVLQNGIVPGEYSFQPAIPGYAAARWVLNGKQGEYWGFPTSVSATYSAFYPQRTRSAYENRRNVGIYPEYTVPAGKFRTLYVEDSILDASFDNNSTRYQAFQFAKGIGPVMIRSGDTARGAGFTQLGFPSNTPGPDSVMEEFHLVKHNLRGCPGYDASLPPLPANSGNICSAIYGSNPGTAARVMTEFYNPAFDIWFFTSRPDEKALLAQYPLLYQTTGKTFTIAAASGPNLKPIYRYYIPFSARNGARGFHFYTLIEEERSLIAQYNPVEKGGTENPSCYEKKARITYCDEGIDGYGYLPTSGMGTLEAVCPAGSIPVYRAFRGAPRFPDDGNHRFSTDIATYNDMVGRGWSGEGIRFCVLTPQ
jgi:hypothetical protein